MLDTGKMNFLRQTTEMATHARKRFDLQGLIGSMMGAVANVKIGQQNLPTPVQGMMGITASTMADSLAHRQLPNPDAFAAQIVGSQIAQAGLWGIEQLKNATKPQSTTPQATPMTPTANTQGQAETPTPSGKPNIEHVGQNQAAHLPTTDNHHNPMDTSQLKEIHLDNLVNIGSAGEQARASELGLFGKTNHRTIEAPSQPQRQNLSSYIAPMPTLPKTPTPEPPESYGQKALNISHSIVEGIWKEITQHPVETLLDLTIAGTLDGAQSIATGYSVIHREQTSKVMAFISTVPIVGGAIKLGKLVKRGAQKGVEKQGYKFFGGAIRSGKRGNVSNELNPVSKSKMLAEADFGFLNKVPKEKHLQLNELTPTHALTSSKRQFRKLVENIKQNGIQEPIKYIEHDGIKYIVDGHHRFSAAPRVGLKSVPTEKVSLPFRGYQTVEDLIRFDY